MYSINLVRAIIRHNGKYLLLKKADHPHVGKWECPGGKIEGGESPIQAAFREIFEETGLKCNLVKELPSLNCRSKELESNCYVFLFDSPTAEITLSKEHTSFEWVAPEEVANKNLVLFASFLLEYFRNPKIYLE